MIDAKTGNGATDSITEIKLDDEKITPGTMFNNKSGKKLTIYYVSAKTVNGTAAAYNEGYNSYTTAANNYNYTQAATAASNNNYTEQTQAVYTDPPTQAVHTEPPAPVATEPPAPVVPDPPPAPAETPVENGGGGEAAEQ
jgi:serine/threonine-protein kinase